MEEIVGIFFTCFRDCGDFLYMLLYPIFTCFKLIFIVFDSHSNL